MKMRGLSLHIFSRPLLFLLLFCLLSTSLSAQSGFKFYDEITLPQTDAWNFVRQGDITPSMYTGTINLSVPIYNYKDRDFNIPITATYSSNGNTPNQLPGWLGPGWSLNIGGCITVETRGVPDYGENVKQVPGFYTVHKGPITTTNGSVWLNSHTPANYWRFMRNLLLGYGSGTSAPEINVVTDYDNNIPNTSHTYEYDAQPDIFHFTLPNGHSGTFHLGFNKQIIVYNTPAANGFDYKVEIEENPLPLGTTNITRFNSITITTPDGYRYVFDGSISNPSVDMTKSGERSFFDLITAWHLTRIVAPNGSWAELQYTSHTKTVYTPGNAMIDGGVSDNQYYTTPPVIEYYSATGLGDEEGRSSYRDIRTATLDRIIFSNGSRIEFGYSVLGSTDGDQYKTDPASTEILNYPNTIRLSSISVYPTLNTSAIASASFTHKRNTNGARTSYLGSITVQGEGTYSFDYYGWNDSSKPYPPHNCYGVDHWGYYNGKSGDYYPASTIDQQIQREVIIGDSRNPDSSFAKLGILSKITYPTGGWSTFEYEPHDCSTAVERSYDTNPLKSFAPRIVAYSQPIGGLRITKIDSYLANGILSFSKEYSYTNAIGNSSGILTWIPRYGIAFYAEASSDLTEGSIYRSSSLQEYGFTNIEYSSVIESIKDSSRIVNLFTSSADGEGFLDRKIINSTVAEKAILSNGITAQWGAPISNSQPLKTAHDAVSPITSFHSERGKLKEKRVYKTNSATTPSMVESTYFHKDMKFTSLPCYLVRQFGVYDVFIGKYYPSITTQSIREDAGIRGDKKEKLYSYNLYGEIIAIKEPQPQGDTIITEYKHLRDLSNSQINASAVYKAMKRKNTLSLPLDEKIYLKKSGSSQKVLIGGRICTYALFPNNTDTLILPSYIDSYDKATSSWKRESTFTAYDSFGNIKEMYDAQHTPISYLWSSDGQELVLQAKGLTQQQIAQVAQSYPSPMEWSQIHFSVTALRETFPQAEITAIEYIKGVGPSKIEDSECNITLFTYTRWGKLKNTKVIKQSSSITADNVSSNNYSNDQ